MKEFETLDKWRYAQWPEGLLLNGDCGEILKDVPDDSVDMIFTDPPFSLGFMGLAWDQALPSVKVWKECYRVLKPGCFAFVMSIPRQDCQWRMIANLEEAGFDISYSPIYHAFAQGFPKAMNMGKKLDERLGMDRKVKGKKPGTYADIRRDETTGQDSLHGGAKAKERARIEVFETLPASTEAKALEGSYSGLQLKPAVEVILCVQKPFTKKHKRSDVYKLLDGKYDYWYTQRTEVSKKNKDRLSEKWNRAFVKGDVIEKRLALRPELQDEVVVNRETILRCAPYKDSDIASTITHALDTGKGVTWLQDCRIPHDMPLKTTKRQQGIRKGTALQMNTGISSAWQEGDLASPNPQGRFPANLLVSDDVLNDGEISSSHNPGSFLGTKHNDKVGGNTFRGRGILNYHNDSGSFSRYFSLDAWAQKHLPESVLRTFPFLLVPKPSPSEKNAGLGDLPDRQMYKCDNSGQSLEIFGTTDGGRKPRKNFHPTAKSVKLVSYVLTMASRPGDVVLDPFIGSGTTGVSAFLLKRRIIGCEIDEESCYIAMKRMEWGRKQAEEEKMQLELFNTEECR